MLDYHCERDEKGNNMRLKTSTEESIPLFNLTLGNVLLIHEID